MSFLVGLLVGVCVPVIALALIFAFSKGGRTRYFCPYCDVVWDDYSVVGSWLNTRLRRHHSRTVHPVEHRAWKTDIKQGFEYALEAQRQRQRVARMSAAERKATS